MPLWVSTGTGSAAGTERMVEMDLPPVQMALASLRAMKHGEFRLNEELACCSEYEVSSKADGYPASVSTLCMGAYIGGRSVCAHRVRWRGCSSLTSATE